MARQLTKVHQHLALLLISSWLCVGTLASVAGFVGLYSWPLVFFLFLPGIILIVLISKVFVVMQRWGIREQSLVYLLATTWLIHLVSVFVPEHGFDAVWYHLPLIQTYSEASRFVFLPQFYQSVNPQFSDALLGLGYFVAQDTGVKMVAYALAVTLAALTYFSARLWIERRWALLIACVVSLMQVVAWQASSAYVDVAKALWEVGAVMVAWQVSQIKSNFKIRTLLVLLYGALCGASLATKLFSVILLPVFIYMLWEMRPHIRVFLMSMMLMIAFAVPFWAWSWYHTGNAFVSAGIHLDKLTELTGAHSWSAYIQEKTIYSWEAPFVASFGIRDYTNPCMWLFIAYILYIMVRRRIMQQVIGSLLFAFFQVCIWWYIPPLSTRYALSGFIIIPLIFCIHFVQDARVQWLERLLYMGIAASCVALLVPRLFVTARDLQYLLGYQTKKNYIEQFYDGNADTHLRSWHQLP